MGTSLPRTLILAVLVACRKADDDTASHSDEPTDSEPVIEAGDDDEDGWTPDEGDCDDGDPEVHPGRTDGCDGADDDCDDEIDEDGATYYADEDGDGFGDAASTVHCDRPADYTDNGADCDDGDASVHPGAVEAANSIDDDCDGDVDEDVAAFEVTVSWDAAGLTVEVVGGPGALELGMAETGAGSAGWFGETCILGAEPWGYDDYDFDVCHPLGANGGAIDSVYPNTSDVEPGSTLFPEDIGESGSLTYALFDTASAACWVWGDDVSYYDDFGCTAI